jgi:heterokaryon incompatibility protein (HET)
MADSIFNASNRLEMLQFHLGNPTRQKYQYTPLAVEKNDIRLLDLHAGKFNDPIQCSLRHVFLQPGVNFTALSYAWGDPNKRKNITINQCSMSVTINLYDALQHMRHITEPRSLWIDALCINQEDLEERAAQVLRMGDIFSKASQVEAWIGKDDKNDHAAIDFIESVKRRVFDNGNTAGDFLVLVRMFMDVNRSRQELSKSSPETILGLIGLFRHPWWKRLWVVQEMSLADPTHAIARYGSRTIHWQTLLSVAIMLFYGNFLINLIEIRSSLGETIADELHHGLRMFASQRIPSQPLAPFNLTWLLLHHRGCETSDPRDRVYALLGICGDAKAIGVKPDYTVSPQQLYLDIFKKLVTTTASLDVICGSAGPGPKNFSNLPSWVPDWSYNDDLASEKSRICIPVRYTSRDDFPGAAIVPERYRATGSSPSLVEFSSDGKMTVAAIKFGRIIMLGNANKDLQLANFVESPNADEHEIFRVLEQSQTLQGWKSMVYTGSFQQRINKLYGFGNVSEAFYRTLIVDRGIWYDRLSRKGRSNFMNKDSVTDAGDLVTPTFSPADVLDMPLYLYALRLHMVSKRRLAILDTGYIGIVPNLALIGDHAAVLLGCSVPVLIRSVGENAIFVGETYFHGVMDGELTQNGVVEHVTLV